MALSHSGGVGAEGKQLGPGEEIQIFLFMWNLMPNYLQGLKVLVGPLHWLCCTWLTHFWKSCCELLDLLHVSEALEKVKELTTEVKAPDPSPRFFG